MTEAVTKKHTPTPITVTHPENVDLAKVRLYREPPWKLRLTIESDRSYTRVKIVRAAPLSHPDRYICLLDAKDEEVCMVPDMKDLDDDIAFAGTAPTGRAQLLDKLLGGLHAVRLTR